MQMKTKRHRPVLQESDEAKTKKRKLTRVTETRALWDQMEKSGEPFETWEKQGFKTPKKPKKPKPTLSNKRKAAKKRASKKRPRAKRSRAKRSSKK